MLTLFRLDKNPDRFEECTAEFQLVQAAYSVLGDENERAWYDNHRSAILNGKTEGDYVEGVDLAAYFTPAAFNGYDNKPDVGMTLI